MAACYYGVYRYKVRRNIWLGMWGLEEVTQIQIPLLTERVKVILTGLCWGVPVYCTKTGLFHHTSPLCDVCFPRVCFIFLHLKGIPNCYLLAWKHMAQCSQDPKWLFLKSGGGVVSFPWNREPCLWGRGRGVARRLPVGGGSISLAAAAVVVVVHVHGRGLAGHAHGVSLPQVLHPACVVAVLHRAVRGQPLHHELHTVPERRRARSATAPPPVLRTMARVRLHSLLLAYRMQPWRAFPIWQRALVPCGRGGMWGGVIHS